MLEELMAVVLADEELVLPVVAVEEDVLLVDDIPVDVLVVEVVVPLPPAPPEPSSSPHAARAMKNRPKAKVEGVFIRPSLARRAPARTKRGLSSD
ncbi:MAG: hypothetical protein HOV80_30700 [Polyangiaceae bacterium]|nr:hypothetical protein [Polyangiaceae bacterium]